MDRGFSRGQSATQGTHEQHFPSRCAGRETIPVFRCHSCVVLAGIHGFHGGQTENHMSGTLNAFSSICGCAAAGMTISWMSETGGYG
jgi:hypothetical protein